MEQKELPDTRPSITHKTVISSETGDFSLFFTVGLYEDGQPAELFLSIGKQGSTIRGLMDTIGMLTSYALQYGIPYQDLCKKFKDIRFEPMGRTSNKDIPECSSIPDYIFRWMELRFGS